MDFLDISKKRRTVRKFAQTPVEKEKLQRILEAGRWSPTAVNYQPQRILVLNSPESLAKVREFCSFGYDQKYVDLAKECDDKEKGKVNFYYGAPLVLFVCYDTTACWTHPQSGKSSGAKLIGKILLLPVVLLLAILRLLVKIGMEVSSFILGALMLIVFGCIIFTIVQHTWNSMAILIVMEARV